MARGRDTRWYVLTGAPGVGKTTMLEALRARGIETVPEAARQLLEKARSSGGRADIARRDERRFQDRVLESKLEAEAHSDERRLTVFDRGIPDTLAYYRLHGWKPSPRLTEVLGAATYAGAFMLEPLPAAISPDPLRTESPAQQHRLVELLASAYRDCGVPLVRIPPVSRERRVAMVLEHLSQPEP